MLGQLAATLAPAPDLDWTPAWPLPDLYSCQSDLSSQAWSLSLRSAKWGLTHLPLNCFRP